MSVLEVPQRTFSVWLRMLRVSVDLVGGQGADQVGEGARRDGGGAFLLDLGADPAGDAQLQVGGGKAQAPFIGGDQDIGQHGQGAAGGYGTRDDAQAMRQIFLQDGYFHIRTSPRLGAPGKRSGCIEYTTRGVNFPVIGENCGGMAKKR